MAEVILKNVRKSFGNVEIIKGVNLEIKDREFAIFVGPPAAASQRCCE
jgi:ABC-type sugar transport system ATPase subunit